MKTLTQLMASPRGVDFLESQGIYTATQDFVDRLSPPAKPALSGYFNVGGIKPVCSGQQLYVDYKQSVLGKIDSLRELSSNDSLFPFFLWVDTDRSGSDNLMTKFIWPAASKKGPINILPPGCRDIELRLPNWDQGESHENLMDDPASATTKDTLIVDHTLEFDVAYYLDQLTSSAIDLSLTNATNANKFGSTPNRTTERTGIADAGKADAAFHYEMLYLGDVIYASTTSTLVGNGGPGGQSITVSLLDAGALPLGSGYRVAFDVDASSPPITLKNPSDAQDPLVPLAHIVATDLGNGNYELRVSTAGVPGPDTVTLHVYVDGVFINTIFIPVT